MRKTNPNTHQMTIAHDTGFNLTDIATAERAFADEKQHPRQPDLYIYSRYRNPTVVAVEEQIMALEGAQWALLTQSGMAAIDTALSIFETGERTGAWLFFSEIYGGTHTYIDRVLRYRRGIQAERFEADDDRYDLGELERRLDQLKPRLLYFEAVSNPLLMVADVEAVLGLARKRGIVTVVDNTFATPYLWQPLADGADIVLHSATKYLAGHGNLTAGVVCGNQEAHAQAAIEYRKWVGHMLGPDDAFRLGSFLKTFGLRVARQCENALRLAQFLSRHPHVERVLYPGLPSHPSHREAKKLFRDKGYGGVVTFDLAGASPQEKRGRCDRLIARLKDSIPLVPTLGDVDTILLPVQAVWGDKYPFPGMVRLSVGVESYPELEASLARALE